MLRSRIGDNPHHIFPIGSFHIPFTMLCPYCNATKDVLHTRNTKHIHAHTHESAVLPNVHQVVSVDFFFGASLIEYVFQLVEVCLMFTEIE